MLVCKFVRAGGQHPNFGYVYQTPTLSFLVPFGVARNNLWRRIPIMLLVTNIQNKFAWIIETHESNRHKTDPTICKLLKIDATRPLFPYFGVALLLILYTNTYVYIYYMYVDISRMC